MMKRVSLYVFALFYIGAGINHFLSTEFYETLMPPYLPLHRELVYLSGIIEIALGILVLSPEFRVRAAWAVIVMLFAFMPVHIHMVMHPELYPAVPEIGLWLRLPMQALFMLWAWWYTRPDPKTSVA